MIGREIFGYTVDETIGSGSFGTVYKVSKMTASGREIRALKHISMPSKKQYYDVLYSMGGNTKKADDYFFGLLKNVMNEVTIIRSMTSSNAVNIVNCYESSIIRHEDPLSYDVYILMEYLTPLADHAARGGFTVKDVICAGLDILSALKTCHAANIIHRDIKEDNIFVSADGTYKLGDFGVSKNLSGGTHARSMKGTPNYIAPEVYLGKEQYDNTVDLYSLGIVLYRMLNMARGPFLPVYPASYTSADEDAAFESRMKGQIPELPYSARNVLGQAVVRAIASADQRYSSAKEFEAELLKARTALSTEELNKPVYKELKPEDKDKAQTIDGLSYDASFQRSQTFAVSEAALPLPVRPASQERFFQTISDEPEKTVPKHKNSSDSVKTKRGFWKCLAIVAALLILISGGLYAAKFLGIVEELPWAEVLETNPKREVISIPKSKRASAGMAFRVTASSGITVERADYVVGIDKIADGDLNTAWMEGTSGTGEGEWIKLSAADGKKYIYNGFEIANGYQSRNSALDARGQVKMLTVSADGKKVGKFTLEKNKSGYQSFTFNEPVACYNLMFQILSVYPGTQFRDCYISEIRPN